MNPNDFTNLKKIDEIDIDKLVDFVLKNAFEGLMDSDQWSVERAIREWFKVEVMNEN